MIERFLRRGAIWTLALLALLCWQPLTHAGDAVVRYQIGGQGVDFLSLEGGTVEISAGCRKQACQAWKALKKASPRRLDPAGEAGGTSPGARLCEQVHGLVVLGTDGSGNQTSFCQFQDASLLSTGSLVSAGVENDRRHRAK